MQKRDFETYQKRFRDFEVLPKFSETHVLRGTICHPSWRRSTEILYLSPLSRGTFIPYIGVDLTSCCIGFRIVLDITRISLCRVYV